MVKPSCWECVWGCIRYLSYEENVSCAHPSPEIRRPPGTRHGANACSSYLYNDPKVAVQVVRDTRETFMKAIHKLVVDNGLYARAENVLSYFCPNTSTEHAEITCDDFRFATEVNWGGNEGTVLGCYAVGVIQQDGKRDTWHLGTYKSLQTSLEAMRALGELGGYLTYYAGKYLRENAGRFIPERQLRARALLSKMQREQEAYE